jgi:urease accessory protein
MSIPPKDDPSLTRRILKLRFEHDGASTRLFVPRQDTPWRVIRAFPNSQGQVLVHLHNVSGGVLSGDSLDLSVEAGRDTRVQLTSVGATRIYRSRPGAPHARLATSIRISEGALVEYLPDAVIPFAGSCFEQSTSVLLERNSGFIGWEILAAGRIARGEEFVFDFFRSEYSICGEARPLAIERYLLIPSSRDPRSVARLGGFRYSATLYICRTGFDRPRWVKLESQLNELGFALSSSESRWGASALAAAGLVVRGVALNAPAIIAGLFRFWTHAKREIWGEAAVVPRKIN